MKNLGRRTTKVGTFTIVTLTTGEEVTIQNPSAKSESTEERYIFELTDSEAEELFKLQRIADWQLAQPSHKSRSSSDITPLLMAVRAFVEARLQVEELRRTVAWLEGLLPVGGRAK